MQYFCIFCSSIEKECIDNWMKERHYSLVKGITTMSLNTQLKSVCRKVSQEQYTMMRRNGNLSVEMNLSDGEVYGLPKPYGGSKFYTYESIVGVDYLKKFYGSLQIGVICFQMDSMKYVNPFLENVSADEIYKRADIIVPKHISMGEKLDMIAYYIKNF